MSLNNLWRYDLITVADRIRSELARGHRALTVKGQHPREERYVAEILVRLVRVVQRDLAPLFAGHGITIEGKGAFTHGKGGPMVASNAFPQNKPQSVEIGDMMVVVNHVSAASTTRHALLFQAKMYKGHLKPDNDNQLELYHSWPPFTYSGPGALTGQQRNVTAQFYDQAQYLFIDGPLSDFTAEPDRPSLTPSCCLSWRLTQLLCHRAGRSFVQPPPANNSNWDRVVDDILAEMQQHTSSWMKASNAGKPDRIVCFFAGGVPPAFRMTANDEQVAASFTIPAVGRPHGNDYEPPIELPNFDSDAQGGFGVLEITLRSEDEVRREDGESQPQ